MSLEMITVPNLTAAELITRARSKLELTDLDEGYRSYDFVRDECGQTYEVLTWTPNREVTTEEVRRHFKKLGADGNTAAFIAWVTKHNPEGFHVSIPSEDSRLYRDFSGLYAPNFEHYDDCQELNLEYTGEKWRDVDWTFVAFREVTR